MPHGSDEPTHVFFFFNDTATTEICTLSLHDALPICRALRLAVDRAFGRQHHVRRRRPSHPVRPRDARLSASPADRVPEIGEHTSELQSRQYLVCRLLLEKKTC